MQNNRKWALYIGCLLIASCISEPMLKADYYVHHREEQGQNILGAVVGFLGVATGAYLLGYCCGWWGSESDEQLVTAGNKSMQLLDRYSVMMHMMMTHIVNNVPQFDPYKTFDENLLYQLAFAKRGSITIEQLVMNLQRDIYAAQDVSKRLDKRLIALKKSNEVQVICYELNDLSDRLYKEIKQLDILLMYISKHKAYFKLFEYEDQLRNQYARELLLFDQYLDVYGFREGVRMCAFTKYEGPFALLEFVKQLKNDITFLEDLVAKSPYNYAVRINYIRDLVSRLRHVEQLTLSDNEYTQALLEYQREQRQKELLKIEKERLALEQRQAKAQERAAAAQEAQALLKAAEVVQGHNIYVVT